MNHWFPCPKTLVALQVAKVQKPLLLIAEDVDGEVRRNCIPAAKAMVEDLGFYICSIFFLMYDS